MSKLYFPKPQPLSPLKTARWKMEVLSSKPKLEVRYYLTEKGKKKTVKGVELSESIYYWWFEYLKLSDKYQRICGLDAPLTSCDEKGYDSWRAQHGDTLFADFGNIFQYEGAEEFWQWWKERGQWLFGIKPMHSLDEFSSVDDVIEHRELVDSGAVKLVALPTTLTPATLQRRLAKLISQLELSDEDEEKAKYHPHSVKVDVESLCTAYQAYQLRKQGKSNVFIGAYFSFCSEQQREFLRDGRERGKTFDFKAYEAYIRKNRISVEEEDEAIQRQEIVFYMDGDRRTAKKNYLNVKASRMVAKAEDNIRAVEERRFPVGTPQRLVKGSAKAKGRGKS